MRTSRVPEKLEHLKKALKDEARRLRRTSQKARENKESWDTDVIGEISKIEEVANSVKCH